MITAFPPSIVSQILGRTNSKCRESSRQWQSHDAHPETVRATASFSAPKGPKRGFRVDNTNCYVTELSNLRQGNFQSTILSFGLDGESMRLARRHESANNPQGAWFTWSVSHMRAGVVFPLHDFFVNVCNYAGIAPAQLTPNSYAGIVA